IDAGIGEQQAVSMFAPHGFSRTVLLAPIRGSGFALLVTRLRFPRLAVGWLTGAAGTCSQGTLAPPAAPSPEQENERSGWFDPPPRQTAHCPAPSSTRLTRASFLRHRGTGSS